MITPGSQRVKRVSVGDLTSGNFEQVGIPLQKGREGIKASTAPPYSYPST